jgi:hypothetical protein
MRVIGLLQIYYYLFFPKIIHLRKIIPTPPKNISRQQCEICKLITLERILFYDGHWREDKNSEIQS